MEYSFTINLNPQHCVPTKWSEKGNGSTLIAIKMCCIESLLFAISSCRQVCQHLEIWNWQLKVKAADGNTAWLRHSHNDARTYIYSEILYILRGLQMDVDII